MNKFVLLTGSILAIGFSSKAQTVIADWTFETSQPTTAGPFNPEVGAGTATGHHVGASVYTNPTGNGSSHSFSSTIWAIGDYYQVEVSTIGLQNITLSYDQTSSNTGPGKYLLEYSTDGTTFTPVTGTDYTVLANNVPNVAWTPTTVNPAYTFSADLSSITALNNAATVFFRFADDSTTSANGGTVATAGTDRIDNIIVSTAAAPEPSTMALLGMGGVAGLFFFGRRNKK